MSAFVRDVRGGKERLMSILPGALLISVSTLASSVLFAWHPQALLGSFQIQAA